MGRRCYPRQCARDAVAAILLGLVERLVSGSEQCAGTFFCFRNAAADTNTDGDAGGAWRVRVCQLQIGARLA